MAPINALLQLLLLLLFYTPGRTGPGVKNKEKRLKANVEWLEVQIDVPSE